jgi:uncharacterized protein (DUF4415 family)
MNKQVSKTGSKPAPQAPLIDASGEVRELTADDLKSFKPARDVSTTIRLSPDVLEAFKSQGNGWQTRIDTALKDWLRTHSPA